MLRLIANLLKYLANAASAEEANTCDWLHNNVKPAVGSIVHMACLYACHFPYNALESPCGILLERVWMKITVASVAKKIWSFLTEIELYEDNKQGANRIAQQSNNACPKLAKDYRAICVWRLFFFSACIRLSSFGLSLCTAWLCQL